MRVLPEHPGGAPAPRRQDRVVRGARERRTVSERDADHRGRPLAHDPADRAHLLAAGVLVPRRDGVANLQALDGRAAHERARREALVNDDQADGLARLLRVEQAVQPLLPGEGLHGADHDVGRHVVGRRLHLAYEQARLRLLQLVQRLVGELVAVHEDDDARTLGRHVLSGHAGEHDRLAHPGGQHDGRSLHPLGPRGLDSIDALALVRAELKCLAHWSVHPISRRIRRASPSGHNGGG